MKTALEIIEQNEVLRQLEKAAQVKQEVLKEKVSLSTRMECAEKLKERWPHNPMAMNYKAMEITDEELK